MSTTRPAPGPSALKTSLPPKVHAIRLKPRKGLFIGLLVALGIWVVFLIGLYVLTIPPRG